MKITQVSTFRRLGTGTLITASLLIVASPVRLCAQMNSVQTVFIIVMENKNWSQIQGNPDAPYINAVLLPNSSYAQQYFTPPAVHPSLPNYLWLEAGTNFGILNNNLPSQNHQSTTDHLAAYLENAGVSWKTYQEDIEGTVCPLENSYPYAPKHNPFVYFDDMTDTVDPNSAHCIAHVRPYAELAGDLETDAVAQYNFITPNLCNDMHDTCAPISNQIRQGDTWLSEEVPKILSSTAYLNNGALFIVWDEGSSGSDEPIPMILLSPLAKGNGYSNCIYYTHGSLLRTIQEIFNALPLLGDAANQDDLSDLFATGAP